MMAKREAILESVIVLSDRFQTLGEMTVSAIAEHAGIGKGTVYEYFPSKEQMIEEAACHFMRTRFSELASLSFEQGFRSGFSDIVTIIRKIFENNRSFLRLILLSEQGSLFSRSDRIIAARNRLFSEIIEMLSGLADRGKEEGLLTGAPKENDLLFSFFCIASAICCVPFCSPDGAIMEISAEDAQEYLYGKFIKLLEPPDQTDPKGSLL